MAATSEKAARVRWSRLALAVLATLSLATGPATASAGAPASPAPLTDEQWTAHVQEVDAKVADALAQGRATSVTHTVDGDGVRWLPERAAWQRQIAAELYARGAWAPDEGEVLFTGGLPGAGKTTALHQNPDVDPSRYLVLNADDAKEKLCEHGLVPEVDGIAPLEGSELVQKEASVIADLVTGMAAKDHKNVIWDTTMSSHDGVDRRVDRLRDEGYDRFTALFLDVPIEVSLRRVDQRHREGYEKYRDGDRCEGRHVLASYIQSAADPDYTSVNRRVFEDRKTSFDRWYLYDATDIPATLVDQG
ncbi:zeta toxin family protein [Actinosynnema sp. NPDC023587]|uniref:zeta toxin family protein n=1 Tax=Actinosynnema sp. NPDC023587 TaxID=3154695 RepID=UPI0033C328D7